MYAPITLKLSKLQPTEDSIDPFGYDPRRQVVSCRFGVFYKAVDSFKLFSRHDKLLLDVVFKLRLRGNEELFGPFVYRDVNSLHRACPPRTASANPSRSQRG